MANRMILNETAWFGRGAEAAHEKRESVSR